MALDVPPRWGGEPATPSRTVEGEVDARWWRSFGDDELTALAGRVASQNLDLRIATERVIQSAAQSRITAAQGLPHVDGTSLDTYNRFSSEDISKLVTPAPGAPTETPLYVERLSSSWELDLFGRVRRAVEAADAETLASAGVRHGVALASLAELAQSYLQLRGTQARIAVARANLLVATRNVALVEDRLGQGYATTLDLAQARAQRATVEATLPPLLATQAQLINAVGLLLGEAPRALEAELAPPRILPRVPRRVSVGLPGTLVRRRPDVRAAEARLHAATAQTGIAVASFYPTVTLGGTLNLQALRFGNLAQTASTACAVVPAVRFVVPPPPVAEVEHRAPVRPPTALAAALSAAEADRGKQFAPVEGILPDSGRHRKSAPARPAAESRLAAVHPLPLSGRCRPKSVVQRRL